MAALGARGNLWLPLSAPTDLAASAETSGHPPLTQRVVLRFYRPLALSWMFMAVEGPVSVALIARRPDSQVNTAAFFVLMSLALWIESPVIDLLSTATTLARNRQHFVVLTRFAQWVIAAVTAVHFVLAVPLYGFVTRSLLDLPPDVAAAAHIGMIVMIPWSGLIGWRRYLQGVLIRHGQTRLIGWGTGVRVSMMATAAWTLFHVTDWPGIPIAATSLLCSVASEALFIHVVSRRTVRDAFDVPAREGEAPLTMAKLAKFHLPLTATTMVMLMSGLVISAALARAPNSVLSLAAWQVATTVLFLHRTIVFALPEVVVALYRDTASAAILRRFCINVGLATSGSIAAFAAVGLDTLFFSKGLGSLPETVAAAHIAYVVGVFMPFLGALQSYVRGMLTAHHLTVARLQAVLVSMACLVLGLAVGVGLHWPGVVTAGVAMTFAMGAELWALIRNWRRGRARLEGALPASA